jgi:hypothetical protein
MTMKSFTMCPHGCILSQGLRKITQPFLSLLYMRTLHSVSMVDTYQLWVCQNPFKQENAALSHI